MRLRRFSTLIVSSATGSIPNVLNPTGLVEVFELIWIVALVPWPWNFRPVGRQQGTGVRIGVFVNSQGITPEKDFPFWIGKSHNCICWISTEVVKMVVKI
jgi:hypothetical protein